MGNYNTSQEVKDEIRQKFMEVMELCQINQIPFFASAVVENDTDKTEYMNIVFSGRAHNIHLTDDQIERHILISNGFMAVPKRESLDLDMDEIGGQLLE